MIKLNELKNDNLTANDQERCLNRQYSLMSGWNQYPSVMLQDTLTSITIFHYYEFLTNPASSKFASGLWNKGRRLFAWSDYKDTDCAALETISTYVSSNVALELFFPQWNLMQTIQFSKSGMVKEKSATQQIKAPDVI